METNAIVHEAETAMRNLTAIITSLVMDIGKTAWLHLHKMWNALPEEKRALCHDTDLIASIGQAVKNGFIDEEAIMSDEILNAVGHLLALAVRLYVTDTTYRNDLVGLAAWSDEMTQHIITHLYAKMCDESIGEYTQRCLEIIFATQTIETTSNRIADVV